MKIKPIQRFQLIMICLAIVCATAWGEELKLQGRVVTVDKITPLIDKADKVYHVQRAAKPPVIDGKGDEWKGVPAMVLNREDEATGKAWQGAKDLSETQGVSPCNKN